MAEGMRITLSALADGLTVDKRGRKLLKQPFVFQCPPMEEFKIARSHTFGNYDTIEAGQFTRRGSLQLRTWQFDTLVMELGMNEDRTRIAPGWVPYPHWNRPGLPVAPEWYVSQLATLHDSGSPFRLSAQFPNVGGAFAQSSGSLTVLYTSAILLAFNETRKAGEGDAVYLDGVSFSEWRDPRASERKLGTGAEHYGNPAAGLPTTVILHRDGVCTARGVKIPPKGAHHTTLADLAKHFYHSPEYWRLIADVNRLHGGGANTPLVKFKKYKHIPKTGKKIDIPTPFDIPMDVYSSFQNAPSGLFDPVRR